ncbi:ribonuclease HI [Novosphingobium capsulatum]|uniref:Ribonuclease HI n=1 Tax=Novosphingobium capsulatum TaxID=13688 RepID=A0ABU1MMD3_9SPHN|nr:hypothetical protein [Novosphingobium capsulatum]MDR6511505.1 ribonuclease HI [Novosphingobium capsulatum]
MLHIPNFAAEIAQQEALDTEAKLLVQTILAQYSINWGLGPWGTSDTLYSAQDWQEAARLAALDCHYDYVIQMMTEEDGYQADPRCADRVELPWAFADMARVFGGYR